MDCNQAELRWIIRPMKHSDIDRCLNIWSQVELTEAKQTVISVLTDDPDGFYVAESIDTGEVIGMCAGPKVRSDNAFIGFYAVDPQYQRLGIGKGLWTKTMARLDSSINVGLYGVPGMSEKYKKSGFVVEDSTQMLVFESQTHAEDKLDVDGLKDVGDLVGCKLVTIDRNSSESMFSKLVDYDSTVQKFSRRELLRIYLMCDDSPLTIAVVKENPGLVNPDQHPVSCVGERKSSCCVKPTQEAIREDEFLSTSGLTSTSSNSLGDLTTNFQPDNLIESTTTDSPDCEILGYGIIRLDNNDGGIIGPIYADSSDICEVLLKNLIKGFDLKRGHILSAMALTSNKQACRILNKVGLMEIERCSRMFTKYVPSASYSKIYYIHSPNFTLF